jgi:hypothetical protein
MTLKDKDAILKLINKVIDFLTFFFENDIKSKIIVSDLEAIIKKLYE